MEMATFFKNELFNSIKKLLEDKVNLRANMEGFARKCVWVRAEKEEIPVDLCVEIRAGISNASKNSVEEIVAIICNKIIEKEDALFFNKIDKNISTIRFGN